MEEERGIKKIGVVGFTPLAATFEALGDKVNESAKELEKQMFEWVSLSEGKSGQERRRERRKQTRKSK